jgi:hypothetical protein
LAQGFISYSHRDNQPLGPTEARWVEKFRASLESLIKMSGGALWYDARLSGNEAFTDSIRDALRSSDFFIAMVSPSFLDSDWCPTELAEFVKRNNGGQDRIFKVEIGPVSLGALERHLQGSLGYSFRVARGEREHLLFHTDSQYWVVMQDIAFDFAKAQHKLQGTAVENNRGSVHLPPCTLQATTNRSLLRRELEAKGYQVERDTAAGQLLSIHVIGSDAEGEIPFAEGRRHLVWITPGSEGTDYAKNLRGAPAAGTAYELIEGLADSVKGRMLELLEKPQPAPRQAGATPSVYVICDSVDLKAARDIRDSLVAAKYRVDLPLFDGTPEEIRRENEECLKEADAALVVATGQNPGWLRAKMREVRRAAGLDRHGPLPTALLRVSEEDEAIPPDEMRIVRSVQEFIELMARGGLMVRGVTA